MMWLKNCCFSSWDHISPGSMDADNIVPIAISAIVTSILCPTVIYFTYELYMNWDSRYILGRRKSIILLIQITIFYYVLSYFPFQAMDHLSDAVDPMYWRFTIQISNLLCCAVGFSLMSLRVYLLYFDHEYNNRVSSQKWKILVDPNVGETDWFLLHRHTKYGNESFLILRILTPFVILFVFTFIAVWIYVHAEYNDPNDETNNPPTTMVEYAFTALIGFICVVPGFIFWRKYPNFNDNLLIRKEMTNTIKINGAFVIIQVALILTTITLDFDVTFVNLTINQFLATLTSYFMIKYPQRIHYYQRRSTSKEVSISAATSWKSIVTTQEGYESFANFLEREFSIENILFITEVN